MDAQFRATNVPLMANSAFLSLISPEAGGAAAWAPILTTRDLRAVERGIVALFTLRQAALEVRIIDMLCEMYYIFNSRGRCVAASDQLTN